jgi:hypothetical protein
LTFCGPCNFSHFIGTIGDKTKDLKIKWHVFNCVVSMLSHEPNRYR